MIDSDNLERDLIEKPVPTFSHPAPSESADSFLGGRLWLRQAVQGHRAGTDALLLAAAAPGDYSGLVIDVGAGVGAAGLALAVTRPHSCVALLEKDSSAAAYARANLIENGLAGRGFVAEADLVSGPSRRKAGLDEESAGLVLTNPPFFDPGRTRLSPDRAKRCAHAMPASGPQALADWIAAALALVAPGGMFILIHRPEALTVILDSLARRVGAITLLPVHPRQALPAGRILMRGTKGSRAPLSIAPPLFLHDEKGFTAQAEAIHRNAQPIPW